MRGHADTISMLRAHRQRYVGETLDSARAVLASGLVCDAVALGMTQVSVTIEQAWTIVSAEGNWLTRGLPEPLSFEDVFHRLVPLPALGGHATRHEAYVLAYASSIVIRDSGTSIVLVGNPPQQSARLKIEQHHHAIAFLM